MIEKTQLDIAYQAIQDNERQALKSLTARKEERRLFEIKFIKENKQLPERAKIKIVWPVGLTEIIYLTGVITIRHNEATGHFEICYQYTKANKNGSENKWRVRTNWLYEASLVNSKLDILKVL